MIIQLVHKFAKLCNCKQALLKDVVTLSQFMKNMEKESKKQGLFYKDSNTFKGEAFECFVEFLNKKLPLYIYDYAPLSRSDTDTGVDGIGTGLNGKPATVQIKYRDNTQALLTANEDHLSNFTASSVFKYNVDPKDTKNMIVFTTAKDLHYFTKNEMLFGKVVCIGFDEISQLVDNNIVFWRDFKESLLAVTNTDINITFKVNKLYTHQKEALDAINKNSRGIIHLPTGTGKTTIIARSIINKILKNPNIEPIVVASPRIILTHQILNDIRGELLKHKINCKYISVNSGRAEDNNDYRNLEDLLNFDHHLLENTTCVNDIKNAYINSKATNVPLIILAVYNSVERIVQASIPVDSIYCDEAHYLLNEQFNYITNDNIFNEANKYYFTATLRETKSDDSVGMNNKNKYGEIIYAKSPAEMIKAGIIVRPRVHIVSSVKSFIISSTNPKQKDAIDPHAIITAFEEHKTLCKTGAKLLVICKGTEHLEGICNSKYFISYCNSHPTLSVYSVTSQFGAKVTRDLNGDGKLDKDEINKSIKRTEMLKQIKALKDSEDAIIFHIDILTEGIDVPGITAIIPLTPMSSSKMQQNLGRAERLHVIDREKLAKKKLSTDFSKLNKYGESIEALKYVKPYCYIILPNYTEENIEQKENWKELILNLRTYGFNPTEDVVLVANRGTKKPQPLSTLNSTNTKVKGISTKVIELVNEIEKEEETNKFYTSIANCKTLEELSDLYGI